MSLGKKLRILRNNKQIERQQLADAVGITYHALSKYETDERDPDYETLVRIADYFNVTTDYLLGHDKPSLASARKKFIDIMKSERGQALPPDKLILKLLDAFLPAVDSSESTKILPILGNIRAGLPILADEHIEGLLDVPTYLNGDYVLRVYGDSMIGVGILNGDLIICKETQAAQSGQIVVALHDQATGFSEATLKYFYDNGNGPVLRAANPYYIDINMTEGYRIVGVMVAMIREEAPGYQIYKEFLATDDSDEWTEVVEEATTAGIKPERLTSFIRMLKEMK